MFGGIRQAWREARGVALRKEFEDTLLLMNNHIIDQKIITITTIVDAIHHIESTIGHINNISPKTQYRISGELKKKSKIAYQTNVAKACGLFIVSALLESRSLPGTDAAIVRRMIDELVDTATATAKDFEGETLDIRGFPESDLDRKHDKIASDLESKDTDDEGLDDSIKFLEELGYRATPHGTGIILAQLMSECSPAEAALYVAINTLALDIVEFENDLDKLMGSGIHCLAILKLIKSYKERGLIRESEWENSARGLYHLMTIDKNQMKWCQNILSDPVVGDHRLAHRFVNFDPE